MIKSNVWQQRPQYTVVKIDHVAGPDGIPALSLF